MIDGKVSPPSGFAVWRTDPPVKPWRRRLIEP